MYLFVLSDIFRPFSFCRLEYHWGFVGIVWVFSFSFLHFRFQFSCFPILSFFQRDFICYR
ncbi:hypothetical protein BDZ91DRAFT_729923 [Kalaharituber pfeilii]|nr:hypothetical protein BDZ91DRAFT_729923 [Kalaharituber pfeilii]